MTLHAATRAAKLSGSFPPLLITHYDSARRLVDVVSEQQPIRDGYLGADICASHDLRYGRSPLTRFLREAGALLQRLAGKGVPIARRPFVIVRGRSLLREHRAEVLQTRLQRSRELLCPRYRRCHNHGDEHCK